MPWVEGFVHIRSDVPVASMIAPCDVRLDPIRERIQGVQAQFLVLEPEWNEAQQKRNVLDGKGMMWTDDVPRSFSEENTKTLLNAAIEQSGKRVNLVTLDCSGFPCVAILEARRQSELEQLYGSLTERGFEHLETLRRGTRKQTGNRFHLMLLAFWPEEMLSKKQREQIGYRMDALMTPLVTNGAQ